MKNLLLITLISAAAGSALVSCDNGAYSASPSGGGSSSSGSIDGKFNGTYRKYSPATWYDTMNLRGMGGAMMDNNTVTGTISLGIGGYSGAATYSTTSNALTSVSSTVLGANNVPTAVYIASGGMGHASVQVNSEANNKMAGTYNAVMYRSYPSVDMNDSIVITDGNFNVPKQ